MDEVLIIRDDGHVGVKEKPEVIDSQGAVNSYIIFPYKEVNGRPVLYSLVEMSTDFPYALAYLTAYRTKLDQRNMPGRTNENWFAFGRSQSIRRFLSGEHLVWPVLSTSSNYVYDNDMVVFTGGGNGPFYGIEMKTTAQESIFYIQAVLNHLIKKLELPSTSLKTKRIRARERVVDVWKVHGSLDWFVAPDGTIASFPLARTIPENFQPLIVPPGKDKYSSTHDEPYRTIIAEADNAFVQAGAYLCVGYGFNDEHIQPKLLAQITNGKPIVVLARTMTQACKKHIVEAGISKYLIFEFFDPTHTKVYGNGWEEIYEGQYWLLDNFMKIW